MDFSENLELLIKKNSMTYTEFGQRIGVSPQQIGIWVRNENMPNTKSLLKICKEYDVTPNWLLGYDNGVYADKLDEVQAKLSNTTYAVQDKLNRIIDDISVLCDTLVYMKKKLDN